MDTRLLRFKNYFFCALIFCFITIASIGRAQTTGSIRGVVNDPDGQPVPGVTITIKSESMIGGARITNTNDLGVFRFPSLPVGIYSVVATLKGFDTVNAEKIKVSLDATANVPLTMKPTMSDAVTVVGETPIIDPTKSGLSTTFSNELVQELPTQRNMWDLMQQAPGISNDVGDSQDTRMIAFGSNRQSNSWNIDGVNVTSPETGDAWWYVNPDTIDEIEVMGVAAPAEYGNFSGAVLNVVTKKGGNNFHAGASYFFQDDALTGVNVELPDSPFVFHRDEYHDITAQMGGPISKDKIWFFGSMESLRDSFLTPGVPPSAFAPPTKSDKYDLKITTKLGEKNELSGFFHDENYHYTDAPSQFAAGSTIGDEHGSNPAWGASFNSTLANNLLLEVGYAGWWSRERYNSADGNHELPVIDFNDGTQPETYTGSTLYPFDYTTYRHQLNAKASYYADQFLKTQHEFRFGVQYSYGLADTTVALGPNGYYQSMYNSGGYQYLYQYQQVPYHYGGITQSTGVFVDDTVTVNSKLTLNLGIRYDHDRGSLPDFDRLAIGTPSVSEVANIIDTGETIPGIHDFIRWDTVSPRLGFVFQTRKDGRAAIRGSFGVYHDADVIGNWDSPPTQRPLYQALLFNPETGKFEPFYEETPLNFAYNKNIKPPVTLQYAAGYEHQIGDNTSFDVQYVYKDVKDLIGWNITGGVYEQVPFTDPFTGRQYTLLNEVVIPLLQKGNTPGDFPGSEGLRYFQKYQGVVLSFSHRFSDKFALESSYTWSKSTGLIPRMLSQYQNNPFYGSQDGSDPNNFINAEGRLQGDRPHMFRVQGLFSNLPWNMQVSAAIDISSGRALGRQIRIRDLNQASVDVLMDPIGTHRYSPVQNIDLSIGKKIDVRKGFRIRLDGTIYNLLNSDQELSFATLTLQSPAETFVPDTWTKPRRLQVRLGFEF